MRVPLSWLRDFAPFEGDPVALGETFDDLGMVVEGIERVGEGLGGVVVARVLDIQPIKKADKIRQVLVDAGGGEPVQVVCGAWNFDVGATVPFATVGAVLPGDFEITARKMRGVDSFGMICSAAELRLGDEAGGIMLLPDSLEPGTPVADALGIEADVVYDLAIEGNRPDANCVAGVARDAAARLKLPFSIPTPNVAHRAGAAQATIAVESPDLCPRFTATVVTGVAVQPSPDWIARRLTLAGMRPINNIVDASNYVMLELGQPTHPYDLDALPGGGLLVRAARQDEAVVTLDGVERRLGDGDDCLICDAESTPVGIGGIMGGASSEITEATTRVLLEAAYFTPMAIARTSKRIGLRSEASARFERGCDPLGIERSVERFCELLGATEVSDTLDFSTVPTEREPIRVRVDRVNAVLGTALDAPTMASYLTPIGFQATAHDTAVDVVPPSFRPDVSREIEVIEEIARHHGYSNIVTTVPSSPFVGALTPFQRARRVLKDVLVGAGVSEAMFSPLLAPGDLERAGLPGTALTATDPLAREESVLRTSQLPGLLKALAGNASHRNAEVALFEVGHVFGMPAAGDPLPDERERLAVVLAGDDGAPAAKRLLDGVLSTLHRGDLSLVADTTDGLHPTRTARIVDREGATVGWVGEVDPSACEAFDVPGRVGWLEADLALLLPSERSYVQSQVVSKLPSSDIDLAFVVPDGVAAAAVEATLRETGGELLVDLRLFDVYRGAHLAEGTRSLAYRLRFQSLDRTLNESDLAEVRTRCIAAVEAAHDAQLRA
ncbi:MAG TPA: phenylalanine--tRNA ligase subunit beta [Acidimicrobiales bacterium]|nr:phenylalanine--tRNA ligase subunit beta [Acidimicrobiales bacterium]